jgi:hypothetical protein
VGPPSSSTKNAEGRVIAVAIAELTNTEIDMRGRFRGCAGRGEGS